MDYSFRQREALGGFKSGKMDMVKYTLDKDQSGVNMMAGLKERKKSVIV